MATYSPNIVSLTVHGEIAEIARHGRCAPEVEATRRQALRESIMKSGVNRPIYFWRNEDEGYVLEGMQIFEIATELGLAAGVDYAVVEVELPNLEAAKKWRYERAVTTQKEVPTIVRCLQAVGLFKEDAKEWSRRARINQRKGGQRIDVGKQEKIDTLNFFAQKACVSRSTMGRVMTILAEKNRDPKAVDPHKRQVVPALELAAIIEAVERNEKTIKNASEDVKNERQRVIRTQRNAQGAPDASEGFVCDSAFDPTKPSQIIRGDSLELMQYWATLSPHQRPQPSVIFGSPNYWIAKRGDRRKEDGKGQINYGKNFQAMMEQRGIVTWEAYVENYLRPYIAAAYELLPNGGRLIFQVDNTRGRDAHGNLIVFWHTDEIRRIGREFGFIPSSEIIWRKSEISGRKQGFGSQNSPTIRPNHEYLVVMRKNCNSIEGDFESRRADMNELAISSWDEKSIEQMSEMERVLMTSAVWDIGAARSNVHTATFPQEVARRAIRLFAPIGSLVLDPWNGTGNTCAAAVLTGRRFIGIDIEPYNCERTTEKVLKAYKELPKLEQAAIQYLKRLAA